MFLLGPAYPGSPGQRAVKWLCSAHLEQESMQKEAEEQEEVVSRVHVFALDADDARSPERADRRWVDVVPWKTTELADVLHHYHYLRESKQERR